MVERLDLQGGSVSEWIEDQIEATIAPLQPMEAMLGQPTSINDLLEDGTIEKLSAADWAFTTANTRYLTHDLHPYPAKFPPQIPGQLISALSLPGDLVFDPFGGSGTTAVEAVRHRRRAVSLDANPLSSLLGKAKTALLDAETEAQLRSLQGVVQSYVVNSAGKGLNWSAGLIATHDRHIPDIPNLEKWFSMPPMGELALLRYLIGSVTSGVANDLSLLAFSRIVTRVSNQDSETRYVAVQKEIPPGFTLRAFLESLRSVLKKVDTAREIMRCASAEFLQGDARSDIPKVVAPASVDLIVTSPPYPNATDYHLYHRFRLFWLGWDPRHLGAVEIGSHLKHQRKGTGFDEYEAEMTQVLEGCFDALQPGRHAVFIVGDAIFKGEQFSTAGALADAADRCGFEVLGTVGRPIHDTKRSFSKPARRARSEELLVLRRPNRPVSICVEGPAYKMWHFERRLRAEELAGLGLPKALEAETSEVIEAQISQPALWNMRRAAFSTLFRVEGDPRPQSIWQKVLENGDANAATRKDPKYATHGIHPYKGKFYPQLAKSLLNASSIQCGATVLDPYCGSGTVPLECLLNGYRAFGLDMNPLAAKIAKAKTGVMLLDHQLIERAASSIISSMTGAAKASLDQFPARARSELLSWFPEPALAKLNVILGRIRLLGDEALVDFFEVIVSSIIREVSQQEPSDLRIRRRKIPLSDAPVFELFAKRLSDQMRRLERYRAIAARQPGPRYAPIVQEGDSRRESDLRKLGVDSGTVDCVVTSPPYATALPYIDTDRLSILALMGTPPNERAKIEENLTGSREIRRRERDALEEELSGGAVSLPDSVVAALRSIMSGNKATDAGFRRQNMAALLLRYFTDIRLTLTQVHGAMKLGARAYYVVGDSRTKVGDDWFAIRTCQHTQAIAAEIGFAVHSAISIDVTTERMLHLKNAITENEILVFQKR
ncbi:MAG: DNA methyltransferase [Allosphingosinicella sp.]